MEKEFKKIKAKWKNGDGTFYATWSLNGLLKTINSQEKTSYTKEDIDSYFFTVYDVLHIQVGGKEYQFSANNSYADKRSVYCKALKY